MGGFIFLTSDLLPVFQILNKWKPAKLNREISIDSYCPAGQLVEARIDGGKLLYDKKWYHKGQPVFIHHYKDNTKFSGVISAIGDREVSELFIYCKMSIYIHLL